MTTPDTARPCARATCDRFVVDHRHPAVCGACLGRYARAVLDAPDLLVELEVTATRQHRTAPVGGTIVTASPTRPLPLQPRALTTLRALEGALVAAYQAAAPAPCACLDAPTGPWCWDATANRDEWLPEHANAVQVAGWLTTRVDLVARTDTAPDLVDALLDAVDDAERAIDNPPDLVYAGPCDLCRNDLYAHAGRERVRCTDRGPDRPGCGATYDLADRRAHLLEHLRDHVATAAEIAHGVSELAGIKIDRRVVNVWAGRTVGGVPKLPDRRTPAQRRKGVPPRYRIGDVLDLAAASAVAVEERRAARAERRRRLLAEALEAPADDDEGQVGTPRCA